MTDIAAERHMVRNAKGPIVAGYREIQEHWGFENIAMVRIKAKQAGWPIAHRDDPREPTRYVIPLADWESAENADTFLTEHGESARSGAVDTKLSTLTAAMETLGEQLQRERTRAEEAEKQAADLRAELMASQALVAQLATELSRYRTEQEVIERMGFLGRLAWTVRDRPSNLRTTGNLTEKI